ncbi:MAG: uroporphyrinogen-III synthase [Gemmatimonadaceae bacterium]|nr:uroporphyrinogen-III synthase [Gemmatimonadaceae bacterium]
MADSSDSSAPGAEGRLPLHGRRVIVTRPGVRGEQLAASLERLGADALLVPLTRIEPVDQQGLAWRLAAREFDWVLFTSANGVQAAADAARIANPAGLAPVLGRMQVAAVGRATAEALHDQGVGPVVVPGRFDAEALLDTLAARDDVRGRRVLHPVAAGASEVLGAGLASLGAHVETVISYASVPDAAGAAALRAMLGGRQRVDLVTFLAPSAVDAYAGATGAPPMQEIPAASIGPVTTAALAARGIPVAVEAAEATADRLVDAIAEYFALLHSEP